METIVKIIKKTGVIVFNLKNDRISLENSTKASKAWSHFTKLFLEKGAFISFVIVSIYRMCFFTAHGKPVHQKFEISLNCYLPA